MNPNITKLSIQNIWPLLVVVFLPWTSIAARTAVEEVPPTFSDFLLTGESVDGGMQFTLTGNAHINGRKGAELKVVSGPVALM